MHLIFSHISFIGSFSHSCRKSKYNPAFTIYQLPRYWFWCFLYFDILPLIWTTWMTLHITYFENWGFGFFFGVFFLALEKELLLRNRNYYFRIQYLQWVMSESQFSWFSKINSFKDFAMKNVIFLTTVFLL